MDKTKKELIEEVQQYLKKIKVNNDLDLKEFERVVVTAANNVSREFKGNEQLELPVRSSNK
ncbi:hypothetical protein IAI10_16735 [Clostridium sp. 19966]|uniref:hypothetical protein n=1 Tax=Clostridium sp. 19966 TaxID=2768166 RepID=UPI0028DD7206|nr:hypothetical protein [Clostridium sp. 19966]MDT8718315.1 hypothetical protein [Clostridium sp. 19966]